MPLAALCAKADEKKIDVRCMVRHVECKDSVTYGEGVAKVSYDCDLPVMGEAAVVKGVLGWIMPLLVDEDVMATFSVDAGSTRENIEDALESQVKNYLEQDYPDLKEMNTDADYPICMDHLYEVKVAYEDAQRITFLVTAYFYGGGAHGSTFIAGATFSKADGHRLTISELLPGYTTVQVRAELRRGLRQYFGVKTDQQLKQELQIDHLNMQNFPLPDTDPWLDADGVQFLYQQYEIACYAAGMPNVTIKPRK